MVRSFTRTYRKIHFLFLQEPRLGSMTEQRGKRCIKRNDEHIVSQLPPLRFGNHSLTLTQAATPLQYPTSILLYRISNGRKRSRHGNQRTQTSGMNLVVGNSLLLLVTAGGYSLPISCRYYRARLPRARQLGKGVGIRSRKGKRASPAGQSFP